MRSCTPRSSLLAPAARRSQLDVDLAVLDCHRIDRQRFLPAYEVEHQDARREASPAHHCAGANVGTAPGAVGTVSANPPPMPSKNGYAIVWLLRFRLRPRAKLPGGSGEVLLIVTHAGGPDARPYPPARPGQLPRVVERLLRRCSRSTAVGSAATLQATSALPPQRLPIHSFLQSPASGRDFLRQGWRVDRIVRSPDNHALPSTLRLLRALLVYHTHASAYLDRRGFHPANNFHRPDLWSTS